MMDPVQKMTEWIMHPMEFGKKPDTIKLLDQKELFWTSQQQETCYLVEFTVDGEYYIGFTGPITWCFFTIDFKKLSFRELYERYTGWYIAFSVSNYDGYDKSKEGNDEAKAIARLEKQGFANIRTLQKTYISDRNYYEFAAEKEGAEVRIAGTLKDCNVYPKEHVLPYFDFIGKMWDPFYVE